MSVSNGRHIPPPASSSVQQSPDQARNADLIWNYGSGKENILRCKDDGPPFGSSLMFDEARQRMGPFGTGISLNRIWNVKRPESSPATTTRFQVHDKFQTMFRSYDQEMLSKLDSKRNNNSKIPPTNQIRPFHCPNSQDLSSTSYLNHRYPPHLRPLSLPNLPARPIILENSPSPWLEAGPASGPTAAALSHQAPRSYESRSSTDVIDYDKSSALPYSVSLDHKSQTKNEGFMLTHTGQKSSFQKIPIEQEEDYRDDRNLRQLYVDENSQQMDLLVPINISGKKRRASSPVEDENLSFSVVGSSDDFFRRRESVVSRNSTGPRFHSHSGSISSTTSDTRNNSYASTLSVTASSRTSVGSFGRLSPGGVSPKCVDPTELPFTTSQSLSSTRRDSLAKNVIFEKNLSSDHKTLPITAEQGITEPSSNTNQNRDTSIPQGKFVCECCPKKPKKFDTKEELDAHEQEKQYECAYCRNRFKNKNEAERHQNSLHLRRQSWSCAALIGYAAAFHNSTTRSGEADTCGFCGEDFPRSGMISGTPFITKQDWDIRINHLSEIHKFGECNHAKKFFRADHFRQHLKHSHAGTSGKWTNMLENACMRDEPLQNSFLGPERSIVGDSQMLRACEKENYLIREDITRLGRTTPKPLQVI